MIKESSPHWPTDAQFFLRELSKTDHLQSGSREADDMRRRVDMIRSQELHRAAVELFNQKLIGPPNVPPNR
ncbi:hypothetical protein HY285_00515 [Candidatus Peregrinibacteria bacterium]|nr:hypothetical protein [Candidatus Peregrinibacteria bacterium]MBI3816014.1 hypothetical protein [Candidatus Peregrinibacteria bacterium]